MKHRGKIFYLAFTGVFAALITVFTAFFVHIPIGNGYLHFGDTLIYLAAAMLPAPYAMAAGAIGGGLADLLTSPMWTIPTVIIKMLIVLPFTSKQDTFQCRRNRVAPWISFLISGTGYYLAGALLFGAKTALLTSLAGSLAQSGGSAVFFYILSAALDAGNVKAKLLKHTPRDVKET